MKKQEAIAYFGNAKKMAAAAKEAGSTLSASTIRSEKFAWTVERQQFFAGLIKKDCAKYIKLCNAVLDDGGVLEL